METKQAFKALSKICLNNWHYIDRKVLTLNQGINFFTGHSVRRIYSDRRHADRTVREHRRKRIFLIGGTTTLTVL